MFDFVFTRNNAFKNSISVFTYSSFKSVMFLKALPFNPFMSLSFRRLRYLPNKLINSVKIPLKFIAQGRGITETIINVLPIWQKFALLS